jgi:DNA-binding NarL/FixJ family response regulator
LSPQEQEVVEPVDGLSDHEIAAKVGASARTPLDDEWVLRTIVPRPRARPSRNDVLARELPERRTPANAARELADIRAGSYAFTRAPGGAMQGAPLALKPGCPGVLTRMERSVVEGLAAGLAAKQLAHNRGVSLATVRTHIKNAKRKTGARTLRELATFPSRPDWLGHDDDER